MQTQIIFPTLYLPSTQIFSQIIKHDVLFLESFEHYQKQSIRNRTTILTSNGIQTLTIPIKSNKSKLITEIEIANDQNWNANHLKAIKSAYGKSAFFEFYFYQFEKIYLSNHKFLFSLNLDLMTLCLKLLKLKKQLIFTNTYNSIVSNSIYDGRKLFFETSFEENFFSKSDILYYQLFGDEFVNNLSVIDLLFNEGTNALNYLYKIS